MVHELCSTVRSVTCAGIWQRWSEPRRKVWVAALERFGVRADIGGRILDLLYGAFSCRVLIPIRADYGYVDPADCGSDGPVNGVVFSCVGLFHC